MSTTRDEFQALAPTEQAERLKLLAAAALIRFGLPPESKLELLKHRENAVFRVDDPESGNRYALRVHRDGYQTERSVRSELLWMDALHEAGVQTPRALPGRDGEIVQTVSVPAVSEPRHCDVLSWIEGAPLDAAGSTQAYELLGELNARLHLHARRWSLPADFTRQRWDEEGLLGETPLWGRFEDLEVLTADQQRLLREAGRTVLKRLRSFGKTSDRFGLIHADFMPDNVLIHADRASVIDFDDCGFGWHLYDPATLFGSSIKDPAYVEILNAWVEGYRSVTDLPDEQLSELPVFIMARCLVGLGWLHTRRETETAKLVTGVVVDLACDYAEALLGR